MSLKQLVKGDGGRMRKHRRVMVALGMAIGLAGFAGAMWGQSGDSGKNQKSAGIVISAEATAKEVGLPLYPGAKPHKDEGEDSPAAQLGIWGGAFGVKLVELKLESGDAPEKVAAFYRKALSKYGQVLNCGAPEARREHKEQSESKILECGDDKPDAGGMLFKAGTKEKQHIVGVKPNGSGSLIELLYLEGRGTDTK
ncbi:MAG TPA: hypothetical protein VGI16_00820 [Candidatus Acidoferrum sp.]|jgi:hypothetical protein